MRANSVGFLKHETVRNSANFQVLAQVGYKTIPVKTTRGFSTGEARMTNLQVFLSETWTLIELIIKSKSSEPIL